MKTLKTTLLISMLLILTTSCTDLTDNLVPETKTEKIELTTTPLDGTDTPENLDTGGENDGSSGDGGKD